ncbi:SHOCT-like domain-containing protein [Staphylococcus felis]|uniref:SHOCT-like domain-containing protein n=1 Tax=Staphylococcus felis TaxID=46127 RepID=UPI000E2545EA|nr:hypothetical protein [Staphylococcus felis]REI09053.1 hypothetical protein DOS69_02685 [Staphylococcus felis]
MNQGSVKVLELLQEGKISVEEAVTLLDAMNTNRGSSESEGTDQFQQKKSKQSSQQQGHQSNQERTSEIEDVVYQTLRDVSDNLRKGFKIDGVNEDTRENKDPFTEIEKTIRALRDQLYKNMK